MTKEYLGERLWPELCGKTENWCRISKVPEHLQSPFFHMLWPQYSGHFHEFSWMIYEGKMEKFLASLSQFPFPWTWWSTFSGSVSTGQMNFWHLSWYPMPGKRKKSIFNNSFLIYFLCPCSEYPRSPRAAQRHGSSKSCALNAITCCLLLGS